MCEIIQWSTANMNSHLISDSDAQARLLKVVRVFCRCLVPIYKWVVGLGLELYRFCTGSAEIFECQRLRLRAQAFLLFFCNLCLVSFYYLQLYK
jgi:hypothetical protein